MKTASFPRLQRMFGQRDWSAGEPYIVGDRQFGVIAPDGGIEFNRYAMFSEPTGEAWRDLVKEEKRKEELLLSDVGELAVFVGIVLLIFAAAAITLMLDAGL